jgi:DNA-binding transcriptional regulator YhcF (GntR family)
LLKEYFFLFSSICGKIKLDELLLFYNANIQHLYTFRQLLKNKFIQRYQNMSFKYVQIAQILRSEILRGTYKNTMKLPTEMELAESCHVSRQTIRQALSILSQEGLIERHRAVALILKIHRLLTTVILRLWRHISTITSSRLSYRMLSTLLP